MTKQKLTISKILAFIIAVAIMLSASITAFATADSPSLDFGQLGSITLTLYSDENKTALKDGELTLYKVADLNYDDDGNMVYTYTSDFSSSTVSLDDIEDSSLPVYLETIAENLDGSAETVSSYGRVKFEDLSLGLYLIVQTENSTGYYPVDPFMVTIPIEQDGEWVYDVDASPKVEINVEETTDEEVTEITTATSSGLTSNTPSGSTGSKGYSSSTGTGTGSKLPKTGQLVWPIPVLAVCGLLLFALGWYLVISGKKKDHEA